MLSAIYRAWGYIYSRNDKKRAQRKFLCFKKGGRIKMISKHIGEKHGDIEIICRSTKEPNGYLTYYWCKCSCGNIKRYRYDQARRVGNCGLCEDFSESEVIKALEVRSNGKE